MSYILVGFNVVILKVSNIVGRIGLLSLVRLFVKVVMEVDILKVGYFCCLLCIEIVCVFIFFFFKLLFWWEDFF